MSFLYPTAAAHGTDRRANAGHEKNKDLYLNPRTHFYITDAPQEPRGGRSVTPMYSGYAKYSDPFKSFTLCFIAAICKNQKKILSFLINVHSAPHLGRKKLKCRNVCKFITKEKVKYHTVLSIQTLRLVHGLKLYFQVFVNSEWYIHFAKYVWSQIDDKAEYPLGRGYLVIDGSLRQFYPLSKYGHFQFTGCKKSQDIDIHKCTRHWHTLPVESCRRIYSSMGLILNM